MTFNFGVLGAAKITPLALLEPVSGEPFVSVRCVAARDPTRAAAFAETHAIPIVHRDYQAVLDDPLVDAVYVPLPISEHAQWTVKALAAGKHVLCEKSLASNTAEVTKMRDQATACGLVLMEAFHYRYHPLFQAAVEVMQAGEIGVVEHLDAVFQVKGPIPSNDIRRNYGLGGGVLMDIGCYPISWIRHLMQAEPVVVSATAITDPDQVDVEMRASLSFELGATAMITGSMKADVDFKAVVEVFGSEGQMTLRNPLAPQLGHELIVTGVQGSRRVTFDKRSSYAYQLDAFLGAVQRGHSLWTDANDAVKQLTVIDACYKKAGLRLRGG
ncbi:MAG: Gfo/Idh/MocA family oxidoreductase [Gammaproteobacteria bacterium]|nr:Gfo/Idh/MocA family oxidoreductase [Gammaproteobacteria bacterium]